MATSTKTSFELELDGDKMFIYGVEADFTFSEPFLGEQKSPTLKLSVPDTRPFLYEGKLGDLPTLPFL